MFAITDKLVPIVLHHAIISISMLILVYLYYDIRSQKELGAIRWYLFIIPFGICGVINYVMLGIFLQAISIKIEHPQTHSKLEFTFGIPVAFFTLAMCSVIIFYARNTLRELKNMRDKVLLIIVLQLFVVWILAAWLFIMNN